MKTMKYIAELCLMLSILLMCSAAEVRIEGSSLMDDRLCICISSERRTYRSRFGMEDPLAELSAWSLECREIRLSDGRNRRCWRADLKKELRLENEVVHNIIGMAGENVYFKYSSAKAMGPILGRTNISRGVVLINSQGLHRIGSFPTNLNWYAAGEPLPGMDGSLKKVYEDGTYGSLTFSVADLIDIPSLAARLKQPTRAFDIWLAAQLSPSTQDALSHYSGLGSDPTSIQQSLPQDLNRIIGGTSIHQQSRFDGIELRMKTKTLLLQHPKGEELLNLNRLLIEDAYPLEVTRNRTFLFTTNGIHQVASPLVESPALAEDWKNERTVGFAGLTLGTFGPGGEFLWHLRFPPGIPYLNFFWDEPLEIVQQVRERVQVQPVRHRNAAVLWDGKEGITVLSQGRKSDWHLGIDHPNGERTDLGGCSGSMVTDPTARTLVIILDSKAERDLRWGPSRKYEKKLRLRVFRIENGQLTDREVHVVLN